jgi:hypothetical protein
MRGVPVLNCRPYVIRYRYATLADLGTGILPEFLRQISHSRIGPYRHRHRI